MVQKLGGMNVAVTEACLRKFWLHSYSYRGKKIRMKKRNEEEGREE